MKLKAHMTKTICARLALTLCFFGFNSCTRPRPVELKSLCQNENDNIYVSVEGYLRTGASVLCSSPDGSRACGLELSDKPDGTTGISVYVEEGTGKSQMEPLPKSYSRESLKIHTADGNVLGTQDRVRVFGIAKSGTDVASSSLTLCYINVDKIEKP